MGAIGDNDLNSLGARGSGIATPALGVPLLPRKPRDLLGLQPPPIHANSPLFDLTPPDLRHIWESNLRHDRISIVYPQCLLLLSTELRPLPDIVVGIPSSLLTLR